MLLQKIQKCAKFVKYNVLLNNPHKYNYKCMHDFYLKKGIFTKALLFLLK